MRKSVFVYHFRDSSYALSGAIFKEMVQSRHYSYPEERLFYQKYSKQEHTSSKIPWGLNSVRRNLSLYQLVFLLGLCTFSFALLYLFFPWTSLSPSYKDRKLKFKLVTNLATPSQSFNGTYLLILVTSAPSHFENREAIRSTWANRVSLRVRRQPFSGILDWKIVFLLGKTNNASINALVQQEAAEFDDILVGEFQDTYGNLVIKTIMGLLWASRINCTHVLKADDDVYVHVPRLIKWLRQPSLPIRLYAGFMRIKSGVVRRATSKFFVDWESYPESYFPSYSIGSFYLLSRNILPALVNLTSYIEPIAIEDAYVGILTQSLGVGLVDTSETFLIFYRENPSLQLEDCKLTSFICLGHLISPSGLHVIHSRLLGIESLSPEQKNLICVREQLIFVTGILCLVSVVVVVLYFSARRLVASLWTLLA